MPLTPQQIAEMDKITGLSTSVPSRSSSRADEIRSLAQKSTDSTSFVDRFQNALAGPERQERVKSIVEPYAAGEQGLASTGLQLGGEVIKGAFSAASELPVVKQGLQILGQGIQQMSQGKLSQAAGKALTPVASKALEFWDSLSDEEKRNVDATFQFLSVMPVGKAAETGVQTGLKAAETGIKATKGVTTATGRGVSQVLGATTGSGASSVKEAFMAASEGRPALESFTKAMRGQTQASDIVKSVEDITQTIREQRATNYTQKLKEIGEDTAQHNISPVLSELDSQLSNFGIVKKSDGTLDFSRSAIAKSRDARNDIQGVFDTIKDWGTKPGDMTGIGLDTLKRQLGDFYSESSQARAFVQGIKRKVTDILEKEVKGYKEMTSEYQKASSFLDDIRSATGVGTSASSDTIFTKLTTGMKADKEFRLEILREMEKVDPQLMNKIAGINLSPWMPRGLVGRATDAGAALGALTGLLNPQLIPFILATSPRVVGEFARAAGIASNKINEILRHVKTLTDLKVDVNGIIQYVKEDIKKTPNMQGGYIKNPLASLSESEGKGILGKQGQKTSLPNTTMSVSKVNKAIDDDIAGNIDMLIEHAGDPTVRKTISIDKLQELEDIRNAVTTRSLSSSERRAYNEIAASLGREDLVYSPTGSKLQPKSDIIDERLVPLADKGGMVTVYRASAKFPDILPKDTYVSTNPDNIRYYAESWYKGDPKDIQVKSFKIPANKLKRGGTQDNWQLTEDFLWNKANKK